MARKSDFESEVQHLLEYLEYKLVNDAATQDEEDMYIEYKWGNDNINELKRYKDTYRKLKREFKIVQKWGI